MQKYTVTRTREMIICAFIGSDLFVVLLSVGEHAHHVMLSYSSARASLTFPVMFCFVSCLIFWSTHQKSSQTWQCPFGHGTPSQ